MQLAAGARLSHYEILSLLGSGGMGEVYRARDNRLNRDVAIKVLQPALVDDADHLARFGREAQLLAALNHPNIAQLLGVEEAGEHRALVMELVDGPTLAERLAAGPLPLDEALATCRQIVEALEAAHAAGIVHRDLKPANIKVRDDGTVKVLDFGLAKAFDRATGAGATATTSPTISMHATAAGIILGTAAYMSPEQVRGRPVDKRADIWAFGAVLYEVLTGRRAFDGGDIPDTLAHVLTKDPDWTALTTSTPAVIQRLVRRCLQKDVKRRLPDIGVARLDIDEAMTAPAEAATESPNTDKQKSARRWLVPFGTGALLAAVAAAAATWMAMKPAPVAMPVARFGITLPPDQPLAISFNDRDLAVSPDGTFLAYTAGADAQLMIRALDRLDPSPLAAITNARAPFISPDGRWVGFFDRLDEGVNTGPVGGGTLRRVPIAGGPPVDIAPITGASRGASWGSDDSIVFATSDLASGLLRVAARGGEPEIVTRPAEGERDHHYPSVLPGGRGILFTIVSRGQGRRVAVLDLRTGQWKTVIPSGSQAEFVETGHLVYQDGGALWAVGFDTSTLDVVGDRIPVLEGITWRTAASNFALSRQGALVYAPSSSAGAARSLVWVDRQGNEEALAAPQRAYNQPRISPDGTRVGVAILGEGFWVWDFSLRTLTPRPFGRVSPFHLWSRDSRYLILNPVTGDGNYTNLSRRAADGTGGAEVLTKSEHAQRAMDISPDGKLLVLEQQTPAFSFDLMMLSLGDPAIATGEGARTSVLLRTPDDERNASIAPDGRWIAYESNKSGRFQIYVKPFPNVNDAEHQVSTDGGRTPVWSRNGRELFFVSGSALVSVAVQTTPVFRTASPARLFEAQSRILDGRVLGNTGRAFDVSADGTRFLMLKDAAPDRTSRPGIIVVQNWFQDLQARLRR
jgi:serine/threonine-protein kinase